MYLLNKEQKILKPIEQTTFSKEDLKERQDLQEWIDNEPTILGEDLLIIQKEFDEFDKTNERLDLLAIDKSGNLVLIENKLDDSGKDVTWQALKYVSYCSSFNKNDIIEIYQKYLNKKGLEDNAEDRIKDFLDDKENIDEINLNTGYNQRIILVSREFRPEVTSTVLWLRGNNIDIQCIKIIPYKLEDKIIVDIDKIIPVPETEEYVIKLYTKEIEERNTNINKHIAEKINRKYWDALLSFCRDKKFTLYENRVTTSNDSWISTGSGISAVYYNFILLKSEIRVELYIARDSRDENKKIFDKLYENKTHIEKEFGENLNWERLENKKACRISFATQFERANRDEWQQAIEWHYAHMKRLEKALKTELEKIKSSN